MADNKMRYIATRQAGDPVPDSDAGANDNEKKESAPSPRSRKNKEDDIWVRKEYLLFDLDGTLTDPKIGITTCVQYALKSFGIDEPDLDKLEPFIGPPLKTSFQQFYGFDDAKADAAIEKYRERFKDTGIFENEVYRGIPEMLKRLKMRGLHLAVASSKPTVFVERILEHFHLKQYFEVVVGSELDGTRSEKPEIVLEALKRLFPDGRVQKHKVFMIGDRKFDVEGAHAMGIEAVAVSYGYGDMEELLEAHADYIVRSVEELKRFLLRGFEDMQKDLNDFQKMWVLISQFILFVAARGLVRNLLPIMLVGPGGGELSDDANAIVLALGFIAGAAMIFKVTRGILRKTKEDMYLTHLKPDPKSSYVIMGVITASMSVGLAMFFKLGGFMNASEGFQRVVELQDNLSLWAALFTYGIIGPIAEEMLFRGVIYGYVRKFFDVRTAIIGSSILFGVYHGNMVQAVNATILGYLIAYAYEYFGDFRVAICMHLGINILSLLIEYSGLGATGFVCWPVCIVLLAIAIGCTIYIARKKRL